MIYDIFFRPDANHRQPFDSNVRLPEQPAAGTLYAHNTDWDRHYLIPNGGDGGWLKVSAAVALSRR